jgi:hypothetical protein
MLDGTEFFECSCGSDEHTLRFVLNLDEKEIYTSVFLNDYRNIFKRVWTALKYICGYKSRYGHWDCFNLRPEDADRLRALLDKIAPEKLTSVPCLQELNEEGRSTGYAIPYCSIACRDEAYRSGDFPNYLSKFLPPDAFKDWKRGCDHCGKQINFG